MPSPSESTILCGSGRDGCGSPKDPLEALFSFFFWKLFAAAATMLFLDAARSPDQMLRRSESVIQIGLTKPFLSGSSHGG